MSLTIDFEWHALDLDAPFGISRGTTTVSENLVVRIEDDAGNRGVGGAAPADYYSPSRETITAALADLFAAVEDCDPHDRQGVAAHLTPLADYADLDGSLLLAEDTFEGIGMPSGEIDLSSTERAGTGARET